MKVSKLGSQGLHASQMGLGCMGMSDFYGSFDDRESIKVIHRAIDLGITFLDTADMYGPFKNEILVGKAIQGYRDKVTLATKFGIIRDPVNTTRRGINGKPAYVRQACDASLKRLGVDCIDLYYQHRKDPDTPIEDTVGAMADLVKAGKIRAIGLSEVSADTLKRAHRTHPVSAVQSEYSLWTRDPEGGFLELCQQLGIGFVAYSPLGRGFLTGKIETPEDLDASDWRRSNPRFQDGNFQKNLAIVEGISSLASRKECTPAQLALAWVMAQGDFIFPIPGTKRLKYLEENVAASSISFRRDELDFIDSITTRHRVAGSRYHEDAMKWVGG